MARPLIYHAARGSARSGEAAADPAPSFLAISGHRGRRHSSRGRHGPPPDLRRLIAAFDNNVPDAPIALYGLAFVLYLAMIGLVVFASRIEDWSVRPDLATLYDHAKKYDEQTVLNWVAEECSRSVALNEPKLRRKALFVDLFLGVLVLVAVSLSAAALLEFLS